MKQFTGMSSLIFMFALTPACFADPVYSVTSVNFDTTDVLLNDQGQYVFPAYNGAYLVNGYGANAGQAIPINIPGATFINPTGLNNSGQIVGSYATSGSGVGVTFLYSNGQTTNLSTAAGFSSSPIVQSAYYGNSDGLAINSSGAVAGAIAIPNNVQGNNLGLYSQGSVTNLGLPATADPSYPPSCTESRSTV